MIAKKRVWTAGSQLGNTHEGDERVHPAQHCFNAKEDRERGR